ncbi:Response regulator receiver domain-containing protein [Pseudidiomarina planktonica]|uniref:Response regulator receiver domain-containing protein n=1 Tax=Pseudidiomarina planktonica TaxID=1323738 RepID=A0A1Y6EMU6_9GAMM|nr:DUF3369 domain-containing protein [Pseudidiomarina planktonica]RUO65627.1 response regulator [Pseudidiomarina planktonica]SMQ63984.1 Response regulator receiver domain-containing protein [Pseudidiomarina planktonica]
MNNPYMFADEPAVQAKKLPEDYWKVLIVDDEPEVHAVTKLALSDFSFLGRGLKFYSAYSGEEARELVNEHPDAAIVLLDVVMETDDAGLQVARYIREEVHNRFPRIILRTGQPGQAPERTVIINYDINDYKSKTELTAQKLFTTVMSSLRSYRDIMSIDQSRQGLEKVIAAATNLYALQSMESFVDGLVQQLSWVLGGARETFYAVADRTGRSDKFEVKAAYGRDSDEALGQAIRSVLPRDALAEVDQVVRAQSVYYGEDFALAYCRSNSQPQGALLFLRGFSRTLTEDDKHLLQLFAENVQVAHDNVISWQDADRFLATMADEWMTELSGGESARASNPVASLAHQLSEGVKHKDTTHVMAATRLYHQAEGMFQQLQQENTAATIAICQQRINRSLRALSESKHPATQMAYLALRERSERWDGMGLPSGKEGAQIAMTSQIIQLAGLLGNWLQQELGEDAILARLDSERGRYFAPELLDYIQSHFADLATTYKKQQG